DFVVQHSLCLARVAVERALADVDVVVPVERALSYWYPLHPQARIEDGKKVVRFDPPAERLRGERVHQWIGARYAVDRPASDFERLARQQVLVRRLLEEGYPFDRALVDPEQVSSSDPATLDELRSVRATWAFETYT